MRSVRISWRTAQVIHSAIRLSTAQVMEEATAELERAMKPRRSVKAHTARKTARRQTKKAETAAIREAVMKRAGGKCEHCGMPENPVDPLELDHVFGRGKVPQSERNCWALLRSCHRRKTDNSPSAAFWLRLFASHAELLGHRSEAARAMGRVGALDTMEAFGGVP